MSDIDYIAFFCAVRHSPENDAYLVDMLKNYDIGSYLVVRETSPVAHKDTDGQHYHFLVQMSKDDWARYRKRVFVDHFKLRGQAKEGLSRQYGKVNYLKDTERMAIYMCKDGVGGVVSSTFTPEHLNAWYKQSFEKASDRTFRDKLIEYCDKHIIVDAIEHFVDDGWEKQQRIKNMIYQKVVHFYRVEGSQKMITKAALINFGNYYMIYHLKKKNQVDGLCPYLISDYEMVDLILH